MSETFARAEVDTIAKTIECIVKNASLAHDDKERALDTLAEALTRLTSAAHLGKARLRATQNAHASGVARLSPEVIGIIILFLDKLNDRLVASQVCRLWRSVALNMPNPWPQVSLHSLGRIDMGCTKYIEADSDHCYYNLLDEIFLKTDSNLHHLSGLLELPWKAPVLLDFQLTSHCDDHLHFEYPTPSTEAVRQRINKAVATGPPFTRARLAAELGLDVPNDFIDILHPLSAAANRISSITLRTLCNNWLVMFPCLPPMTALRTLVITVLDDGEESLVLPSTLYSILGVASAPQLQVAFPVLEILDVDGISCMNYSGSPLRITAGRVSSFLASMPLLRCLDLRSEVWPDIVPGVDDGEVQDDPSATSDTDPDQTDKRDKKPALTKVDLINLKRIGLHSAAVESSRAKTNSRSISRLMDLLPVNPGSSIDVHTDATNGL